MVWLTRLHPPLLVDVNVSVIDPAVVSAVEGIYVGFKMLLLGENVPVPEDNQVPLPVVEDPFSWKFGLFLQTTCGLAPGITTGAGEIETTCELLTAKQFPLPVVVKVMVKLPELISAELGT